MVLEVYFLQRGELKSGGAGGTQEVELWSLMDQEGGLWSLMNHEVELLSLWALVDQKVELWCLVVS